MVRAETGTGRWWAAGCSSYVLVATVAGSLLPLDTERLRASVGGFAVMNCHLDFPFGNEIPYHLQWDKDGETIFSWYSGDEAPRVADRWGGRLRRLGDGQLGLGRGSINVSAVRETDAGLYRCRVIFPNRSPPARNNGTFYYLDVDGGNLIVTPPMNATVLEGDRAELECLPKDPASVVQWYKDSAVLSELPELAERSELPPNGSLVIRHAVSTDLGEYECRLSAPDGQTQSASAFLDVQYKAKVVYSPKERYLPFGKPASLDCHFSANPPLTNLRWEKDGFLFDPYNVPGVFYSMNGSLLFNRVDESHEGVYSCTPYNALGSEGPSAGVRVRVSRAPALALRPQPLYLARLGASLALPCAAAPQPHLAPVLRWTRVRTNPCGRSRSTCRASAPRWRCRVPPRRSHISRPCCAGPGCVQTPAAAAALPAAPRRLAGAAVCRRATATPRARAALDQGAYKPLRPQPLYLACLSASLALPCAATL
ncbi:unnamed protein product [Parnassius apollo]|uniref:(apollo) hypothetical protein n=1 Tax=Parnassius apollo TaxID=110799 RepID=A0A8S3WIP1_PARAO|nr:unnamed protein product [Parnassius apollo]